MRANLTLIMYLVSAYSFLYAQQWSGSSSTSGLITRSGNIQVNDLHFGKYGSTLSGDPDPFQIASPANLGEHDVIFYGGGSNSTLNLRIYDGALKFGELPTPYAMIRNDGSGYFNGGIGIGTQSPASKLEIQDGSPILTLDATATGGDAEIFFDTRRDDTGSNYNTARIVADSGNGGSNPTLGFYIIRGDGSGWDQTITIKSNGANYLGNVGIGTSNPDEKLTVKGKIHAEEVRLDLSVPGPDYVFEEGYDLKSLKEIEAFIQSEKHLPEVPSAKEMEANGVQLGEMNMLLLKKIEELTLYLIEAHNEKDELKAEVEKLAAQNTMLRVENEQLTPLINGVLKRLEKLENE